MRQGVHDHAKIILQEDQCNLDSCTYDDEYHTIYVQDEQYILLSFF